MENESETAHTSQVPPGTYIADQATSRQQNSSPPDVDHSLASNSVQHELMHDETRFIVSESMAVEGQEEDETEEAEESPASKSFSCVDYLEIMHDEMLNPEPNCVSEPDATDGESDFICKSTHCSFSTTDMEAYLKHEYEHVDGKVYLCDVCHMKFNLFSSMRNHRMSHLSHRPYKCRLCSKEFFRKDVLVEHLVKQHSKQRPYRCPFCPKHFKLRTQLKLHLCNEHSAAMLIKTCKLCGFKAASPNAFRSHFAICYLKRGAQVAESNECNLSPIPGVSSEANAIDLGAVSQNFSFVPSHYAPYSLVGSTDPLAGPSDLTQVVSLHTTTPGICTASGGRIEQELYNTDGLEANIACRVSSLASSTTAAVSPGALQASNDEEPQNLVIGPSKTTVKSEPSDIRGDDSQNGNALPTSTMDLSVSSVVETSFACNEASCCRTTPDTQTKSKASCSSREKRLSESCILPTTEMNVTSRNRVCYSLSKMKCSGGTRDAACRCRQLSCNLHTQHCSHLEKREPLTEPIAQSETEELNQAQHTCNKRPCRNKATSTNVFPEIPQTTPYFSHTSSLTRTPYADCCSDRKSHVFTRNIESNSHTCPFCEISFPDQTLYFLHRSLHSETHPWKCNLCGKTFKDKYDFNSHIISQSHH